MKKIVITSLSFIIFFNTKAFAYLDPGTGSIILGAIAAGISYCSIYWQKIKSFFSKKNKKKNDDDSS